MGAPFTAPPADNVAPKSRCFLSLSLFLLVGSLEGVNLRASRGSASGLFSLFVPKECMGGREKGNTNQTWGASQTEIQSIGHACLIMLICSRFFVKGTIFRWWEQDACFQETYLQLYGRFTSSQPHILQRDSFIASPPLNRIRAYRKFVFLFKFDL